MKAIETTGTINKAGFLKLDKPFKTATPQKVKVIILFGDDDTEESIWLSAIATNPAFDFLKEKEEDIYSITDCKTYSK